MNDKPTYVELENRIKDLEVKLELSEQKFKISIENDRNPIRLIMDSIPGFAFIKDLNLQYVSANRTFCDLLKIPYDQIYGKTDYDIFPKDLAEKYIADDKKVIESGEPLLVEEITVNTIKNGYRFIVATRKLPWFDERGKICGIYGLGFDISELKHVEELIQAKEKAEESETRLNLFFEQSLDGFFFMMLDEPIEWNDSVDKDKSLDYVFEHHRITKINRSMLEQYGAKEEQYIGLTPNDLFAHDIKQGRQVWKDFFDKGHLHVDTHEKKFDGTDMIIEGDYICLYDAQKRIIGHFGIQKEVTDIRHAEEKLKESERKFRDIANLLPQIIFETDKNGILTFVNDLSLKLFGYSEEDFIQKLNALQMIDPKDRVLAAANIQLVMSGVKPTTHEYTAIRKDGSNFPVLVFSSPRVIDGKVLGLRGTMIDITDRKLAEQELILAREKAEENKEKFKLLNSLITEMLLLQDMESTYKFIAENLQRLYPNTLVLYVSIDESIQESRLEAISGLDDSLLMKVIKISGFNPLGKTYKLTDNHNDYFKSGNFIEFDGGLADFSASEFSALTAIAIEKIIGLHKIYTIGINKDDGLLSAIHFITFNKQVITDGNFIEIFAKQVGLILQKKIDEKALMNAKERAEEADRLKSAFLANMSHEIRTPMNGILGFAELLKEPNLSGETQSEYIKIIEKSGARMLNTINDIVDISKIEAGLMRLDIRESNVNEKMEYIYTFFKPEAEAKGMKLSLRNSLSSKEAIIQTDSEKLYAILTNLVKNAIKYTEKGSIEFGYDLMDINSREYLQFYVKDTGIGIPRDRQEAIFERFIQAEIEDKKARQGSGLGLAITKSYVVMLGGKIWVESEVEIGSTFYFTLPYHTEPTGKLAEQNAVVPDTLDSIRKNLKILIAEDDEVSEMLIGIAVKMFGKETLNARTGVEAVKTCHENPDIDLILMDIQMPEMGGYEATRQIREFNKDVIIIAQTAFGQSGDREKAIEAGCNDHISKPIKPAELHDLIKKYFNKKF